MRQTRGCYAKLCVDQGVGMWPSCVASKAAVRRFPGRHTRKVLTMAYKNHVAEWAEFDLTTAEIDSIRATIQSAFGRAGGRGEMPRAVSLRNALKGKVSCDAAAFQAGNAAGPDASEDVALAKAWAAAIAEGRHKIDELSAWPALQKMVATMLRPAAPMPATPPMPMPSARLDGSHGVTIMRKATRAKVA